MNQTNINGSASSPENLSLSAVPPANGRKALYLCATSLVRVGQYRQAEKVCHDLMAHSVRFLDGKNYYASRRLLCTIGSSNDAILGSMDGRPRFLLEADSRVQFDLFCANEELCSSRWENARLILQSLCSSLEEEVGLDEYTSFAFGWLATAIRRSWKQMRNIEENHKSRRELNDLWEHALQNSEIAATHFDWESPLFCRESAWHHVLTSDTPDAQFITSRFIEGAGVAQNTGMVREEYECLNAWQEIAREYPGLALSLPTEWQSRWNCLARQFSPMGGEPNPDEIAFEEILDQLDEIQSSLQQTLARGNATLPRSSHPQTPMLVP